MPLVIGLCLWFAVSIVAAPAVGYVLGSFDAPRPGRRSRLQSQPRT